MVECDFHGTPNTYPNLSAIPLSDHEIVGNYIIIFKTLFGEKRIVKSVKVFSANTESINPIQKYPHNIE